MSDLMRRLAEHSKRGVTTDMARTVEFVDTKKGPPRLDPVENLRDATLAVLHLNAELKECREVVRIAAEDALTTKQIQGELEERQRELTFRLNGERLARQSWESWVKRTLLWATGGMACLTLVLLTAAIVLVFAMMSS